MAVFHEHIEEKVAVSDEAEAESVVQITQEMEDAGARRIYELYVQMGNSFGGSGLAGSWSHAKWGAREIFEAMMKAKNNS